MSDFGERKPVDVGYTLFCACGKELFPKDGVMVCEAGHRWMGRVEVYEYRPFGPKYKAQITERVVWTRLEALDEAWAWDEGVKA